MLGLLYRLTGEKRGFGICPMNRGPSFRGSVIWKFVGTAMSNNRTLGQRFSTFLSIRPTVQTADATAGHELPELANFYN